MACTVAVFGRAAREVGPLRTMSGADGWTQEKCEATQPTFNRCFGTEIPSVTFFPSFFWSVSPLLRTSFQGFDNHRFEKANESWKFGCVLLVFFLSSFKSGTWLQSPWTHLFFFEILLVFLSTSETSQNSSYTVLFVFRLGWALSCCRNESKTAFFQLWCPNF